MSRKIVAMTIALFICVANSFAQADTLNMINTLDAELAKGETTVSNVLKDASLMYLHSLTPFRKMIQKNAKDTKVDMAAGNEPGTRITVKGHITDRSGNPVRNGYIYVYHTSDQGWYSDTGVHILIREGDMRHARLFAYLRTDDEGRFTIETIRPKGYPRSDLAAHIHIHIWDKDNKLLGAPGELQFDDDPRMTPERRKRSLQEGFLISKNTGTEQKPVYKYEIVTKW